MCVCACVCVCVLCVCVCVVCVCVCARVCMCCVCVCVCHCRPGVPAALALLEGIAELVGPNIKDLTEVYTYTHTHTLSKSLTSIILYCSRLQDSLMFTSTCVWQLH